MSCPSDEVLLAVRLGELRVNEARAVEDHCAGCAACHTRMREHEQMLADLAAPSSRLSEDAFVAGVMAACAQPTKIAPARSTRTALWSTSLVAAAAATWLLLAPAREVEPDVRARGTASEPASPLSADVLFVRERVFRPLASARLHEGDALAVRYTNRGDEPRYLAVFVVDARKDVHWIYPAYVDPASNPSSVVLAPRARDRMLDEVVELERPAEGTLQVFALLSEQPVHVRDVEALSVVDARSLAATFGGANVQSWRATWARD